MSQIGAAIEPAAIAGSTIPSIVEVLLTRTKQLRTDTEARPAGIRWAAGKPMRGRIRGNWEAEDRAPRQAPWTAGVVSSLAGAIEDLVVPMAWGEAVAMGRVVVEIALVTAVFLQEVGQGEEAPSEAAPVE